MNKLKNIVFLLIFLVFNQFSFSQNINTIFPSFDKNGMQSDILYNPSSISNINELKDKKHDLYSFYQVYKSIAFSDFQQRLPNLENLKNVASNELMSLNVPLALIYSEYDTFNDNAKNNNLIFKNNNNTVERLESNLNIFEHHNILAAAALKPIQRGSEVIFNLSSELLFNTSDKLISEIQIDFGNGYGYQSIELDESYNIVYENEGIKELKFKITFNNNEQKETSASLNVIYSNDQLNQKNNQEIVGFTSGTTDPPYIQPYNEYPFKGWGEFDIFYSADGVLDKPIFVVDGFDPQDTRNVNAIYQALNFGNGNLGDIVRANGYDVVVLNFPTYFREEDQVWIYGGADYIERNAMLLVELIKYVNNLKVGEKQNVVIGPSMGGLISRYALNYMESIN